MKSAGTGTLPHDPMVRVGLVVLTLLALLAALAPWIAPYDPLSQPDIVEGKLLPPGPEHWLGTDALSRDILSRILHGARITLLAGFLAMGISMSIGILVGGIAGFFGGKLDFLLMRGVDVLLSIPQLVLLLVFLGLLPGERTFWATVLVLGCSSWMATSRLVRAETLSLKEREFVQAGRALGLSPGRLLWAHVLPNCLGPIVVSAGISLGSAILWESSLAYLGLGLPPPAPTWGGMVAEGVPYLWSHPWVAVFPGLAVMATVLCVNLVGDRLTASRRIV